MKSHGTKLLFKIWKSTRGSEWKFFSRFDISFALFCSILFLAAFGFLSPAPVGSDIQSDNIPIAVLRALQLFVLNTQTDIIGSQHWIYLFPKFLAPLFTFGTVLKLLDQRITKLVTEQIVAGADDHIVVIGLGNIGQPIVSSLLSPKVESEDSRLVVAIDLDEDISDRGTFEEQDKKSSRNLILLEGLGRSPKRLLEMANCGAAHEVYICTPSNLRNRTLYEQLKTELPEQSKTEPSEQLKTEQPEQSKTEPSEQLKTEQPKPNIFLYEDPPQVKPKTSNNPSKSNLTSFSVSQAAAKMGVLFHPPFRSNEKGMLDCPRIIIVGNNNLAGYLIREIAIIWNHSMQQELKFLERYPTGLECACPHGEHHKEKDCHNKNQDGWEPAPQELRKPLTIDIVSPNAKSFSNFLIDSSNLFAGGNTFVAESLVLNHIQVCGTEVTREDLLKNTSSHRTIVYIIQDTVEDAEECEQRISVALNDAKRVKELELELELELEIVIMTIDDMSDYSWKGSTKIFGFLSNSPTTKWITGESIEDLKRGIHTTVWNQDIEEYKENESNCHSALLTLGSQLHGSNLAVRVMHSSDKDNVGNNTKNKERIDEAKEKLARMEHERWCREQLSFGVRWGGKRVNEQNKENSRRPSLLNFDAKFLKTHNKEGTPLEATTDPHLITQVDKYCKKSVYSDNLDQIEKWNTLLKSFNLAISVNDKPQN
jgi:hypothetical protein